MASGQAAFASAGTEPPLILRANGEAEVIEQSGLPLGVMPGHAYITATRTLEPGDVLLLFTDGLVERRHEDLDVGLGEVARRLAAHDPARGPAALTADLVDGVLGGGRDDDVCLVAVHVL